jgi:phosphotriesterase-related protein
VACSFPLTPGEKKVLRAAATAQHETGAAVTIHVGRDDRSALEILQLLAEDGAQLERTILNHLDIRVEKFETLVKIADSGCYLGFDLFGHESSYYPLAKRDMPSDAQRLDTVTRLKELGYVTRILISQDICTKHRLIRYGGHGYGHILTNIVPRMRERGFSQDEIDIVLVRNPARVLAFAEPGA